LQHYRPVGDATVPQATRLSAERMRCRVREDLRLGRLKIAWFAARERRLSDEEWADPIVCLLNTHRGSEGDLRGLACPEASVVWCRSDLTSYGVAETVAYEARHLWQLTQKVWAPPIAGDDPVAFCSAWDEWYRTREIDAEAYRRRLAPVAQKIAQRWALPSSALGHAPAPREAPPLGSHRRLLFS